MEINIIIEESFTPELEADWLQQIVEQILITRAVGSNTEVGVVITDQEKIQELNRTYRNIDEATDVLAFATRDEAETGLSPFVQPPDDILHLGEIIISYPQAAIQAGQQKHSTKKEILILTIHGILHLLGLDHDRPELEQQMKAEETRILSEIIGAEN